MAQGKCARLARPVARLEAIAGSTWPELAVADGGLCFCKAAGEVWPKTRKQCCWMHKTANVLGKLPKSQQPKAKRDLQEISIRTAETKAEAFAAFDTFIEGYALKYEKATACLEKDRDALLASTISPPSAGSICGRRIRSRARSRRCTTAPFHRRAAEQDRTRHGVQARRASTAAMASPRQS
jgi:transposase-like protein